MIQLMPQPSFLSSVEDSCIEVIRASASAVFIVNNLMTKHFEWDEERRKNTDLFVGWGKHPHNKTVAAWMLLPSIYQKVE
jgi:hypothetical protein